MPDPASEGRERLEGIVEQLHRLRPPPERATPPFGLAGGPSPDPLTRAAAGVERALALAPPGGRPPQGRRGGRRWGPSATALAIAASLGVGIVVGAFAARSGIDSGPAAQTGPLLALRIRPSADRGKPADPAPVEVDAAGTYLVRKPFQLSVEGTREGFVTVVRAGRTGKKVYAPVATSELPAGGLPLLPPPGPEAIITVLTPRTPGDTVRQLVEAADAFSADEGALAERAGRLEDEIRAALRREGQPWVATSRVVVKPANQLALSALGAGVVGLLGSPSGQGPLLAASAWASRGLPPWRSDR